MTKPGVVTDGPEELHGALRRLVELGARPTVRPESFVRSDDFELESGLADILRRQPDGSWLIAVHNGFNGG